MKYDSVSVSYPNDSTRDILFTRGQEGTNISVWAEKDSVKEVLEDTVINEDEPQASLRAEGGIDMMLRDQSSMVELATFIQRGMHSGLDIFIEPDIAVYDSLLNAYLQERGLNFPTDWSVFIPVPIRTQRWFTLIRSPLSELPDTCPVKKQNNIIMLSTFTPIKVTASQ